MIGPVKHILASLLHHAAAKPITAENRLVAITGKWALGLGKRAI